MAEKIIAIFKKRLIILFVQYINIHVFYQIFLLYVSKKSYVKTHFIYFVLFVLYIKLFFAAVKSTIYNKNNLKLNQQNI